MGGVTLEERENDISVGLGLENGRLATVPNSGRVALGAPGRTGPGVALVSDPGNGGITPPGAGTGGMARLRSGGVEFWRASRGEGGDLGDPPRLSRSPSRMGERLATTELSPPSSGSPELSAPLTLKASTTSVL